MSATQWLVVTWLESTILAAGLLVVTWWAVRRLSQPADRLHVIHWACVMALSAPVLIGLSPVVLWRLDWIRPANSIATVSAAQGPLVGNSTTFPTDAQPISNDGSLDSSSGGSDPAADQESAHGATVLIDATATKPIKRSLDSWTIAASAILGMQILIAAFFAVEGILAAMRLRRLCRSGLPGGSHLQQVWDDISQGRGKRVRLLVSTKLDTPLVFNWWRPTILIPQSVADGPLPSLRFCLAHEWSHIERGDLGWWHVIWFCQFGLWCQPAYWWLRGELRLCQDMLADDRATEAGRFAIEYSELLVDFARRRLTPPIAGAMGLLNQSSQLTRRVTMLLETRHPIRSRCSRQCFYTTAAVALFATTLIGGVRLEAIEAPAADNPTATVTKSEKPPESKPAVVASPEKAETLHYTGVILDKETGKGIEGATVVVRRSTLTSQVNTLIEESRHTTNAEGKYSFAIPPEQVAERFLYIELDVEHPDYSAKKGFGYALSMIRKNETLGERPFFEKVELNPSDPVTGTVLSPDGRPLAGVKVQGYSKASATDFRDYGSFTDTVTDAAGKFRLSLVKGGLGVFWVLPKEFASTSRAVNKERGDVGEIRLRDGVRVSGRVISAEGHPVAGVPVNIDYSDGGSETVNNLPVASSIRRSAITDVDGKFAFDPLPTGEYRVIPSDHRSDPLVRDRTRYTVPGVFLPMKVSLKEGVAAAPIEIQAAPHIVFHAQIFDSEGKRTRGHEMFLFGEMDGQYWFGQGRPDTEGTIALAVPHGLQKCRVQLMTNEHGALRFRRGPGKELENRQDDIDFGTLNDDVNGFEIIRYKAPLVLVSAVDETQQPIKGFRVAAAYPWGKQRYVLEGELSSDLSFEKQDDGRYRTSQMLPDEDVTFTVMAKGYETVKEVVKLAEGKQKELVVTLKKAAEPNPE